MTVKDLLSVISANLTEFEIYDNGDNEIASGTAYDLQASAETIKNAVVQDIETRLTYMDEVIFEVYTDFEGTI